MVAFKYSTLTNGGRKMVGTLEAANAEQAKEMLEGMNLEIVEITQEKIKSRKTVGKDEFLIFNQQLASLTKAGVPLERGLRELAKDSATKRMANLINSVADDLEKGKSLEDAIAARSSSFPPLYNYVLRAGIKSGNLSDMLISLTKNLELRNKTKRAIFEAMSYPLVVFGIGAALITLIFVFIVPGFADILKDMTDGGARLPGLTQMFLTMAENVWQFWSIVGISLFVIILFWNMLKLSSSGRRFRENIIYAIPVVGKLYKAGVLCMFSQAMATLIKAGNDLPSSFRLAGGASGSELILAESNLIAESLEKGTNVVEAGAFCKNISGLLLYSVQLGIQRNDLDENLENIATMYNEQSICMQSKLQSLLLPVMLLFVGSFIALTILAMFLPMITIITSLM